MENKLQSTIIKPIQLNKTNLNVKTNFDAIGNRMAVAVIASTGMTSHVLLEDGQLTGRLRTPFWTIVQLGWEWIWRTGNRRRWRLSIRSCLCRWSNRAKNHPGSLCGRYHCLALTGSGQIFAWGNDKEFSKKFNDDRFVLLWHNVPVTLECN